MAEDLQQKIAEQIDRKIPFAQDAEASVLGAMLMDREAIGTAALGDNNRI